MKRIIEVKGRTGRYDVPSFLWTENETLTIEFKVSESRAGRFVYTVICGEQKKTDFLSENMSFDIPPEFIKNGGYKPVSVLLEFRTVNADRVLVPNDPEKGGYLIEPLYIERIDENTTAVAWLQKVEKDILLLNERIEQTEKRLQEFDDDGVPLLFDDADEELEKNEIE